MQTTAEHRDTSGDNDAGGHMFPRYADVGSALQILWCFGNVIFGEQEEEVQTAFSPASEFNFVSPLKCIVSHLNKAILSD